MRERGPSSICLSANAVHSPADQRINQLVEPVITPLSETYAYPQLTLRPEADCKRYETLYSAEEVTA